MVVSFHPCFVADRNIICAGRDPDASDLAAIRQARAVVLPQGCSQSLYAMAKTNCPNVFPNYDTRFAYPGKLGQIRLFRNTRIPHPTSHLFADTMAYMGLTPVSRPPHTIGFPLVFKFDWGGEGDAVLFIESAKALDAAIDQAKRNERTGQSGFLLQEFIPCGQRVLRVVVAGSRVLSYWRVQSDDRIPVTSISRGALIDSDGAPQLQALGRRMVADFSQKTAINVAGIDLLFPSDPGRGPLFLEINHFFGRRGLGGSDQWYMILNSEIENWLQNVLRHDC